MKIDRDFDKKQEIVKFAISCFFCKKGGKCRKSFARVIDKSGIKWYNKINIVINYLQRGKHDGRDY